MGLQIKHDQINFLSTCCRGLFVFGGTCVSSITHNRENKTNKLHKNPSAHPVKLSAHRHLFLRKPGGGDFLGGFPEMKTQRIWPRRYILSGHGRGYFVSEAVKNVKVKHTSSFWKTHVCFKYMQSADHSLSTNDKHTDTLAMRRRVIFSRGNMSFAIAVH